MPRSATSKLTQPAIPRAAKDAVNYFAHGYRFIDRPYFLAGTAVPDWLNVVDRRTKARSKRAQLLLDDPVPERADVAAGIVQHHADDRWFHQTRAFVEMSLQFSASLRDVLGEDKGFRPSFLGHILVELLLDAILHDEHPLLLESYYEAIDSVDRATVTEAVCAIATRPVPQLEHWIGRFSRERFLFDYADDERLLWRLNHVMKRVRLQELPRDLLGFLPEARQQVRRRREELLAGDERGEQT